jgi:hypothetical protein
MMRALSQLVQCRVCDQERTLIGTLVDIVVPLPSVDALSEPAPAAARLTPLVQALIVQRPDGKALRVSPAQVGQVEAHALSLTGTEQTLALGQRHPEELALVGEVLDHQLVDLATLRVRRVNEVWLDASWRLIGVGCSPLSGLSRLLPSRLADRLSRRAARAVLPWPQVALFGAVDPEGGEFHPLRPIAGPDALASCSRAALAALVHDLRPYAGSQVLATVPPEVAAQVLGRLPPLQRPQVLKHLPVLQAAALVQRLPPAVAVAVLEALPEGRAQAVFVALDPEATTL